MSDSNVLHDTSLTLKSLLDARLNPPNSPDPMVTVSVDSPHRGNPGEFRVNLFLYNVVQDESRRNSGGWVPMDRTATTQKFAAEPLALRLFYLLTAFANDGLAEHHLLGEAMQAFYTNRRIPEAALKGTLQAGPVRADFVEINLLNVDIDTIQKIWGSQTEPIRSSVAYEITAVFLDDTAAGAEVELVKERDIDLIPFPDPAIITPAAAAVGATVRIYGSGMKVAAPSTGNSLIHVLIGGVEATQVPASSSAGVVTVVVPTGLTPGRTDVRIQLAGYVSRPIAFEVLGGP